MRLIAVLALCLLPLCGEVSRVYMTERSDVLGGRSWGAAGPYERIVGKAHFRLDPKSPQNAFIHDLKLAPVNAQGLVEFSADLYVLKPRDSARGNGTLLFEVSNRGGKGMLARFNYAQGALDPRSEPEFGDGYLMEQGYTLVWLGWQWDVPANDKLLRMDAPVVKDNGKAIRGLVRAELIPAEATKVMELGDRGHQAYAAVQAPATLTVRSTITGRRRTIAASQWKFNPARTAIQMEAGFQPGLIYECVYTAENPRLQGAGLAGVRDIVSYFKYARGGVSLLSDQSLFIGQAIGFGISQSGRFLRTLLYYGANEDEQGRKVFDGVWADVPGAGRGSFNQRFAQPSRDGYAFFNTLYATDLFPFADVPEENPFSRDSDALLMRMRRAMVPKTFYTNGSCEYWNRCASLLHTSVGGELDAPLNPLTRLYVTSGDQHGIVELPRREKGAQQLINPVDKRAMARALLSALLEWVKSERTPPASIYPLVADEQLVPREQIRWPKQLSVRLPEHPKLAYELDFGPAFAVNGIVDNEPPHVLGHYRTLLPQVDDDGIDVGGIRLPEVAVPLATFTGWNLRTPETGSPRELAPLAGSFVPFSRQAIAARYGSREEYLKRVAAATDRLIAQRFLLARDRQRTIEHAAALWDFVEKQTGR